MENIERKNTEQQSTTVCMGFSIDGDCRFLSHRDTMRILELAIFRADIDVYLTGGFNPRPKISLPLPRPVAMASEDELLVLRLSGSPEDLQSESMTEKLNTQCPEGISFSGKIEILKNRTLEIAQAVHVVDSLEHTTYNKLAERIKNLKTAEKWLTQRKVKKSGYNRGPAKTATLDIKQMVPKLELLECGKLTFTLACVESRWAKPAELFELLELPPRDTIARTRRTSVTRKNQMPVS